MYTFFIYYDEREDNKRLFQLVEQMRDVGLTVHMHTRKSGVNKKLKHRITTIPQINVESDSGMILKHTVKYDADIDFNRLFSEDGKLSQSALDAAKARLDEKKSAKDKVKKDKEESQKTLACIMELLEGPKKLTDDEIKKILKVLIEKAYYGYAKEKFDEE